MALTDKPPDWLVSMLSNEGLAIYVGEQKTWFIAAIGE